LRRILEASHLSCSSVLAYPRLLKCGTWDFADFRVSGDERPLLSVMVIREVDWIARSLATAMGREWRRRASNRRKTALATLQSVGTD